MDHLEKMMRQSSDNQNSQQAKIIMLKDALRMVMKANDWHIEPPQDTYGKKAYSTAQIALSE